MNISKEGMKRKVDAAKGSNNVNAKTVICDGIEYETITSFSKTFNLNPTTVSTWISGKRTMPAEWANLGLRFKYEETNISKRLSKYSASKNVICEGTVYGTVKECAEHYGINADTMRCWLNGKRTMRKDFIEKGLMYYKEGE